MGSTSANGESLGELEIVKGRVRVFYVQEKMCQAATLSRNVTETIDPLGASAIGLLAKREVTRAVQDELKVENAQPAHVDVTVRLGDLARSVP